MSLPTPLSELIRQRSQEEIFNDSITQMQSQSVVTETWKSGDPTRALLFTLSFQLGGLEDPDVGYPAIISGGFLGYAFGAWLDALATCNFNSPRNKGTFASCTLRLTNNTAQDFGTLDPNDATAENTTTHATYHNTARFTLGPTGTTTATTTVTCEADIIGSDGNAAIGDIDALVNLPGVTVTNITAAEGFDQEDDFAYTLRAQQKFISLSPNGPVGAYTYVVTTASLQADGSGVTNVTRVRAIGDSDFGEAVFFIAGSSGALSGPDATRAQATVEKWAEPLAVDGIAVLASEVTFAVTYELWVYDTINLTEAEIETLVSTYLHASTNKRRIGGDNESGDDEPGFIYAEWIRAQITESVAPNAFKCLLTAPASDVPLDLTVDPINSVYTGQVGVVGTITGTVHIVELGA